MQKSEKHVDKTMTAIQSFLDPFNVSDHHTSKLYCISSGLPVPAANEKDMMTPVSLGKQALITGRLDIKKLFFIM